MSEPILLLVITMDSQNPGQRGHRRNRGSLSTDSKSTTSQCLQVRLIKKGILVHHRQGRVLMRLPGRGKPEKRSCDDYDRSPAGFHMMLLNVAASSD